MKYDIWNKALQHLTRVSDRKQERESKHNNPNDSLSPQKSLCRNKHKENVSHLVQSPRQ